MEEQKSSLEKLSPEMKALCMRISVIRTHSNLSLKEFGARIDTSTSKMSDIENLLAKPKPESFIGIPLAFPEINTHWLITGEGEMLKQNMLVAANDGTISEATQVPDNVVGVPFFPGAALAAGSGAVVEHERPGDPIFFDRAWLWKTFHLHPAGLAVLPVDGQSMEPVIRAGEMVLVDRSEAGQRVRDGIYAISLEDELLVKHIQRLPGNRLRVSSENKIYDPFEIDLTDESLQFKILGRVVIGLRNI